MVHTTSLSLYIINQVLLRRLVLGITARKLSLILEHGDSYVSKIEDSRQVNTYPPHEWPKLAAALGCDINDLLPPGHSTSTGELIEKKVFSLSDEADVRKVIAALKEHDFFEGNKSLEDVVKHLNVQDDWQIEVLKKVLE